MTARDARAAHRQPGAQPDRAGLRARARRAAGRPHRLLRPPERARRRRRQGRRHQGRQPRQAAPAGADARPRQRRREPARDDRRDRAPGATPRRRSSSPIRSIRVDNLALVDQLAATFAGAPGLAERAARAARRARRRAGGDAAPTAARAARPLPDLARPLDDGRARHLPLAHARPDRLADAARGDRRLRRRRALSGARRRRAVARPTSSGYCSARSRSRSARPHVAEAQALCPAARVQRVDGELLSWYGVARRRRGCATCGRWPTTMRAASARLTRGAAAPPWTS